MIPISKNRRNYDQEFNSFKKRLGKFANWFDALESDNQWSLFFSWKKFKWTRKKNTQSVSLTLFLHQKQKSPKYRVSISKLRESTINKIIN